MLGKLYAHVSDPGRLLLVRRDATFPYARIMRQNWRVVAVGVEPADVSQAYALQMKGYCEYRAQIADETYYSAPRCAKARIAPRVAAEDMSAIREQAGLSQQGSI